MDRTTIISELENIKDKVITYEKSVARFKQANEEFEEAKNYEPRRLMEFDNKYFPEYVESKIGKNNQPKEFGYFDPRRFSKKAVANRNSEIEKHNSTILQLKRDFDVQYEGKRQSFKIEDDKEKSEKLQLAEKELQISKEDKGIIKNTLRVRQYIAINWIEKTFPKYRKEMKGLPWGELYNINKDKDLDSEELEEKIIELMKDEDVTNKKGIYLYLLDDKERHLSIRSFNNRQKREAYTRQAGICPSCKEEFKIEEMEADHITPWHLGGKTIPENCQMLCKECNRRKSEI